MDHETSRSQWSSPRVTTHQVRGSELFASNGIAPCPVTVLLYPKKLPGVDHICRYNVADQSFSLSPPRSLSLSLILPFSSPHRSSSSLSPTLPSPPQIIQASSAPLTLSSCSSMAAALPDGGQIRFLLSSLSMAEAAGGGDPVTLSGQPMEETTTWPCRLLCPPSLSSDAMGQGVDDGRSMVLKGRTPWILDLWLTWCGRNLDWRRTSGGSRWCLWVSSCTEAPGVEW